AVVVEGSARMAEMHALQEPQDLILAQYSIPFCVATALVGDARDPARFGETALADPQVRALARRVTVRGGGHGGGWATTTRSTLKDGRSVEQHVAEYPGTPAMPMSAAEREEKFMRLTRRLRGAAGALYSRLERIEREDALDWLGQA